MMISYNEPGKQKLMSFERIIFERKVTLEEKYGSVVGEINIKTM